MLSVGHRGFATETRCEVEDRNHLEFIFGELVYESLFTYLADATQNCDVLFTRHAHVDDLSDSFSLKCLIIEAALTCDNEIVVLNLRV